MNDARLKQIDEDAIAGRLPDAFTVQALCATIRTLYRSIEEQRQLIVSLREQTRATR